MVQLLYKAQRYIFFLPNDISMSIFPNYKRTSSTKDTDVHVLAYLSKAVCSNFENSNSSKFQGNSIMHQFLYLFTTLLCNLEKKR